MKKLIYLIACITLTAISCGVPVTAPALLERPAPNVIAAAPAVNKESHTNIMRVCGVINGLNVRAIAGDLNTWVGLLPEGTIVTLTGETAQPGFYTWYEISSPMQGWVSSRYICP